MACGRCAAAAALRRPSGVPIAASVLECRGRRFAGFGRRRRGGRCADRPQTDRSFALRRARVPSASDEENSRLRRGLTAGSAAAGAGRSLRTRSRAAVSSCQGGGDGAGDGAAGSASSGCSGSGWSRLNRKPSWSGAWSRDEAFAVAGADVPARDSAGTSAPSRRAIFLNSRTTAQRPISIIPEQATIAPARIKVLPRLRSSSIPKPTVRRPPNSKPIPATNRTIIIELTPAAPKARSRQRHDTVILCAPPTGKYGRSSRANRLPRLRNAIRTLTPTVRQRSLALFRMLQRIRGKLRHNSQLLGNGTALYGCRGMRPKSANAGPLGTPGYQ